MTDAHLSGIAQNVLAVDRGLAHAHLTFIPDWRQPRFFTTLKLPPDLSSISQYKAEVVTLLDDALAVREVSGYSLPVLAGVKLLAALNAAELPRLSPSVAVWSLAAKLLLDLVTRERIVPKVIVDHEVPYARTVVALTGDDMDCVSALARSFPLAAHSVPLPKRINKRQGEADTLQPTTVWGSEALLRTFLDMSADAVVRAAAQEKPRKQAHYDLSELGQPIAADAPWPMRFVAALIETPDRLEDVARNDIGAFAPQGFVERGLLDELHAWSQPALRSTNGLPRICFQLQLPADDAVTGATQFYLRFLLQASDDPRVLVPASDVFAEAETLQSLHCTPRIAEEQLLKSLVRAGRIFPPIEISLRQARPDHMKLTAEAAWRFISEAAAALGEAGMCVDVPPELQRMGEQRLRMRMHIGIAANDAQAGTAPQVLKFRWTAELSGEQITAADLNDLAATGAPLQRYRGRWVAVDRAELQHAQKLLAQGGGTMSRAAALAAVLGGAPVSNSTLPVTVDAEEELARLLQALQSNVTPEIIAPASLHGELRPYQLRGFAWLSQMAQLNLGACLADDMGLGKTVQLLAFLLGRRESQNRFPANGRMHRAPILLVCPTSVLSNWQREIERFAPGIPMHAHYGVERARNPQALAALADGGIVMTSYGLLRRDAELLSEMQWDVAVLDEAQNIKNAGSRTARVARRLKANFRVALTGTPVENRLTELWSISEFLNPGLLGSFEGFRRDIALPIERFAREDVAERLKRIVRPLILRRVKTDPSVIQDLPSKQEMTVFCMLTREQASLYQAALDTAMENIEAAQGIERRGFVLALITALKQVCNHPAQYLHEAGPLENRSGKLQRLREMLEETIAAGDRVLVFTQYREMGQHLVRALTTHFGDTVQFLHGGTPRAARDAMVERFQDAAPGPQIFVLSLKAGGTGLNLTAATHVFHYDRWWNPAVEDQATDRAYRIGQHRNVQVHKFLCAGTIEEKIDRMLNAKRDLAAKIVGEGEQWITELDNAQLRELFSLAPNVVVSNEEADVGDDRSAISSRKRKPAKRVLREGIA